MKLWLDQNLELDLSRDAIAEVERAIRSYIKVAYNPYAAEMFNAANVIRAHLQHVRSEPADPLLE